MGASLVARCQKTLQDAAEWQPEEAFVQKMLKRSQDAGGPQLRLMRTAAPALDPSRALLTIFPSSEKVASITVEQMESVKDWAPLGWRHEQERPAASGTTDAATTAPSARGSTARPLKVPGFALACEGPRCKFWRVRLLAEGPQGELCRHSCLMQVSVRGEDRSPEVVSDDIREAAMLARYADAFNKDVLGHAAGVEGDLLMEEGMPRVCLCMPTACRIVESPIPQHFGLGDEVTLLPFQAAEATKFVYDGHEQFLEVPQAFFHYVAHASGGRDWVADLQGAEEEDGSVVLLNPCFLKRSEPPDGGILLSAFASGALPPADDTATRFFERVHPRCGPLCRVFDPDRRIRPGRRAGCGLDPSCGIRRV